MNYILYTLLDTMHALRHHFRWSLSYFGKLNHLNSNIQPKFIISIPLLDTMHALRHHFKWSLSYKLSVAKVRHIGSVADNFQFKI